MLELGRDPDFPEKPLSAQTRSQVGTEHLDRHPTAVLLIASQEHGGHPALPDRTLQGVAAGQRFR